MTIQTLDRIRSRAFLFFLSLGLFIFARAAVADASLFFSGVSTELTLGVSETAAAPGDLVVAFGELSAGAPPSLPLDGAQIEIEVTAPDGSSRVSQVVTNEEGTFVAGVGDLSQQGAYRLSASYAGEQCPQILLYQDEGSFGCPIQPASAEADISVVGDVQLRAPIEDLGVFTYVPFSWETYQGRSDVRYDLVIAADPNFDQIVEYLPDLDTTSALVQLDTQTRFYWRIDVTDFNLVIAVSATGSLITSGGDGFEGIVQGVVTSNAGTAKIEGARVDTDLAPAADPAERDGMNSSNLLFTGKDGKYAILVANTVPGSITVRADGYETRTVNGISVPPRQGDQPGVVTRNVELNATVTSVPGTYRIAGLAKDQPTGTPAGALILANGKFKFSKFNVGPESGRFSLQDVHLGPDETITLFAFADGFAPYKTVFSPNSGGQGSGQISHEVLMTRAAADNPGIVVDYEFEPAGPNRINIRGNVRNDSGIALNAMVLVNGKQQFSKNPVGTFNLLDVHLNGDGRFTLFAFADGHAPYKEENVTP